MDQRLKRGNRGRGNQGFRQAEQTKGKPTQLFPVFLAVFLLITVKLHSTVDLTMILYYFFPSTGRREVSRESFALSQGFTQPDIKYEWNQLYVLGLHYKTSSDGLKNYIHVISGYEASVLWFKPNGKAIVTLKTEKIKGKHDIRFKVDCSVKQK